MTGLITFHWADDYGALLQAYALKTYLEKNDTVTVIPYCPEGVTNRYKLLRFDTSDNFKMTIKKILNVKLFSRMFKRRLNMSAFRKEYLTARKSFSDCNKITEQFNDASVFVVGSDQIWNPEITSGIADGYFCTFRGQLDNCRCVSYAASIGKNRLDECYDAPLKERLGNFDAVSVREAESAPYISSLYGREVSSVADPVFLLSKEEWLSLLPKERSGRYIFVYSTEINHDMIAYTEKLAEEKGLEIRVFNQELRNHWHKPVKQMSFVGPLDFIAYMRASDYVVTNSFHGLSFSIILEKQLAVFTHSGRNARLNALLEAADLRQRVVSGEGFDIDDQIDWVDTKVSLGKYITHSKSFIDNEIL